MLCCKNVVLPKCCVAKLSCCHNVVLPKCRAAKMTVANLSIAKMSIAILSVNPRQSCSAVQCREMVRCSQRSVNIGSSLVLGCGAVRDVQSGALWCRVVHCGGALHRGMVP